MLHIVLYASITLFFIYNNIYADKIYIDISSPTIKKLPIVIKHFDGNKEISEIIRRNLNFTGLFECIEPAQIKEVEQPFNQYTAKNKSIEIRVKGSMENNFNLKVSAIESFSGNEMFIKRYRLSKNIKQTAHLISNDLYQLLVGVNGVFTTKIAFIIDTKINKNIYIMDWDGGNINPLPVTADILTKPYWSQDKSKLIYSVLMNNQWVIKWFDIKLLKEKSFPIIGDLNLSGNFLNISGDFIFTLFKNSNSGIYIGNIFSMDYKEVLSSSYINISASVSPNSKKIVFVSNRSGNPQIYLSDRKGLSIKRLTFEGSYNTSPIWSPNGDKIAYVGKKDNRFQIFLINLNNTNLMQLTFIGNNEEPSFSPDGRFISFTGDRDGLKGIYVMRIDGTQQTRISPKNLQATSPSWSPY